MEQNEARRQEAKQTKQKKQDRRVYKQHALKLLQLIDKYATRPLQLHIWTESIASNGPSLPEIEEGKKAGGGGGGKKKKGRNRSNSNAGDTPKKAHPRSKEAASPMHADEDQQTPLMSISQFYSGKQSSSQKKTNRGKESFGPSQYLGNLVKDEKACKAAKVAAMESIPDDILENEPDAMEMIEYCCIKLESQGDNSQPLSDDIIQMLTQQDIKTSSIVYVVANEFLIYDRHREGLILNERDLILALGGHDELGKRRISVGSENEVHGTLTKLPASILEHTLEFLPDSAVAACCMVCKDWYNEIGQASPNLWRYLLDRKNWPSPSNGGDQSMQAFRAMYLSHYTAMRDVKAICMALTALSTRKLHPEKEMCYQDFATRKQSPSEPNVCVSLKVLSPTQILAAYSTDCSLRLFEAVPKSEEEKQCKELICQWFDPYRNTKRQQSTLLSIDVDEECIGALLHVRSEDEAGQKFILVVVNREDFLLGESSAVLDKGGHIEELALNEIDVGEATINFLLSTDTVDHRQLQIMDFLQDGGDISEIEVLASRTILATGSGRFMVEVSISIPVDDELDDNNDRHFRLVDRKLVLFSAGVGAIIWVGDSGDTTQPLQARAHEIGLTCIRQTLPGDYRPTCHLLIASPTSSSLHYGSVDASGAVESPVQLDGSPLVRNEIVTDGWEVVVTSQRLTLLTPTEGIAADILRKEVGEGVSEFKSVLSLYTLPNAYGVDEGSLYHTTRLNKIEVLRLLSLGKEHLCLVCREYGDFVQVDADDDAGVPQMTLVPQSICMIIIHIPSRQEIYRSTVAGFDNFSQSDSINGLVLASSHHLNETTSASEFSNSDILTKTTVGCALNWSGVAMTGDAVRHMDTSRLKAENNGPEGSAKKKKKPSKKGMAKGRKKDGFARGMSVRG